MRILYLSQLIPYPPDAGPKVRIYHVLQYLSAAGHQVTLLAFRRPQDRPEHIDHLQRYCDEIHTVLMRRSRPRDMLQFGRSLLAREPFLIGRDSVVAMYQQGQKLVRRQRYDAIHADQLWMAQYALAAKRSLARFSQLSVSPDGNEGTGSHCLAPAVLSTVLDQHNAVHLIPQRLAAASRNAAQRAVLWHEAGKLKRYEAAICRQFDHVVWVTEEDFRAVNAAGRPRTAASNGHPATTNRVIPICVDSQAKAVVQRQPWPRRVTFLGGLHWPPNSEGVLWFAREVWPQVLAQIPEAVLTIIGKNPSTALANLAATNSNVELTGYVTDPAPYLAETAAFVVPLHAGGGMRVKILDAWSWGLPVISTTIGAEGICYRNGHDLLIADEAATMTAATVQLLSNRDLADSLGAAGRRAVEKHYDWRRVYPAWEAIYR